MSSLEGPGPLSKVKPDDNLSDFDRKVFASMAKALWIPNEFKEYMVQYLALNQPPISIAQVFGFSQFNLRYEENAVTQATTSGTFTDLATVGPTITGLSNGTYFVFFGSNAKHSVGGASTADIGFSINGAAVNTSKIVFGSTTGYIGICRAVTETLTADDNNSLQLKYESSVAGQTATFDTPWLAALKIANA